MRKDCYQKGSMLTFPLELTEISKDSCFSHKEHLYPVEVMELQKIVEDYCDQMEYDGSLMYDEYPDKASIERLAGRISEDRRCGRKQGMDAHWMRVLAQVLLCGEMSFRRERRARHKRNLRNH